MVLACASAGKEHIVRQLRPLLSLRKADLVGLCRAAGMAWVEDPTNADTSFARNRIRAVLQQHDASHAATGAMQHAQPAPLHSRQATADASAAPPPAAMRSGDGSAHGQAAGQAAALSITADVLQLVAACERASTARTHRAAEALRAALQPQRGDAGAALLHRPLLEAGAPAAISALAAVMQVCCCLMGTLQWTSGTLLMHV